MRRLRIICLLAALVLAGSPALAFQEQQAGGSAPAVANPTPGIVVDYSNNRGPSEAGAELEFRAPPKDSGGGAELVIPGIGSLGVLPKLDFGLELLYGANEAPEQATEPSDIPVIDDDLTIRGIVKHRF
jgi:hypothetical protein